MSKNVAHRIYKFDNIKFLAILLVVLGHFADGYTNSSNMFDSWFVFVYSFHAPLFIFLCGLFSDKYQKSSQFNIKKFTYYLTLGFLLKILLYLCQIMTNTNAELNLLGGAGVEWFLFVTCMYMLTAFLLKRVKPAIVIVTSIVLGATFGVVPISDEFYLQRYFVFLPIFFIGYYLTPQKLMNFTSRTNVKLTSIAFMIVYFILCFRQRELIYPLRMLFTGRNPFASIPIHNCFIHHRLLCYGISAILIIAVISCIPNIKIPLISRMGANTLGVYFWHYPCIYLLRYFGFFLLIEQTGDPLWKLLVLTSALVLGFILSFDIFSYPLRLLYKPYQKMNFTANIIVALILLAAAVTFEYFIPIF